MIGLSEFIVSFTQKNVKIETVKIYLYILKDEIILKKIT